MADKDDSVRIGIWGPAGSGKTTYLATLYLECLMRNDWKIKPLEKESEEFITEAHRRIRVRGEFPPRNDPTLIVFYRFSLVRKGKWGILGRPSTEFILEFPDAAGEWFDDYEVARSRIHDGPDPIKYLLGCDAILILVDPMRFRAEKTAEKTYFQLMNPLLSMINLSRAQRRPQCAAVAITKVDQGKLWGRRNQAEALAQEVLTPETKKLLDSTFPEGATSYFVTSSVGVLEDEGRANCQLFTGERGEEWQIVDPSRIKPLNVFEPVEWLVHRLERTVSRGIHHGW